jgi:MacB-like periplasmic core domain/FtsX-like permease family
MTLRDLKHSARRIASHPGIAAIAILSMALGIGANTTIFSVIHASLLRPLPYPDADRRVIIFTTNLNSPNKKNRGVATTADFLDWRTHSETLEDWHMFSFSGAFTATGAGLPERITYQHVTAGLLDSLGLRPVLGQLFGPGSEAEHPVIISEGYWRRRFGGEADVLGRKLTVNGKVCTIIGVLPADFELFDRPSGVDLWNTIDLADTIWIQRKVPWLMATAKLKSGVSLSQAQSEVSGVAASLAQTYPDSNRHRGVVVTPMLEARNGDLGSVLYPLLGAGLMINTILRMQNHDLGFDPGNVVVAQLHIAGARYMTDAPKREIDMRIVEPPVARFLDHVLTRARALPGVTSAALAGNVPMGPSASPGVRIRVAGGANADDRRGAEFNAISEGFFETLRIPLRRGRYLDARDVESNSWVAIVNEAFAREFFPGGEALGQTITLIAGPGERPREIVGVVADFTQYSPRMPVRPEVYTSYLQQPGEIPGNFQGQRFRPKLILRSAQTINPETIARIVADFDPQLAVFGVKTLEQFAAERGAPWRFYANILGLFSAIALLLAAVGIYGLMNYSVIDRFHEIGIRLALGASRSRIIWLIVSYGLKLTVAGLAAGVAGALGATRLLEQMLFGVKPWDPLTFSAVTLFVLLVAIAACTLPALRATRVDPLAALRRE